MSLQKQLRELRAERAAEMESLRRAARHAQRDVSPKRFIRKYPYAALGLAAVAGMIVAPAPRYERASSGPRVEVPRGRGRSPWYMRLLKRYIPELAALDQVEGADAAAGAANAHGAQGMNGHTAGGAGGGSMMQDLVRQGLIMLMAHVDIAAVVRAWVEGMREKRHGAERAAGKAPETDLDDEGFRRPPGAYTP